jgi:hypothetical protein
MQPVTGSANIIEEDDVILPAGPPHTYFGVAENMMLGVSALAKSAPGTLALPLVAAHVLECLLKAYLSRGGSDAALKKRSIRHDLTLLWTMAREKGLDVSAVAPAWVTTLAHVHKPPYFLRYSTNVHGVVTPGAEPMTSELAALVVKVAQTIRG